MMSDDSVGSCSVDGQTGLAIVSCSDDAASEPSVKTKDATYPLESDFTGDPSGVAKLKPEFIIQNYKPRLASNYLPASMKQELSEAVVSDKGEPMQKKLKLKGMNKRKINERWHEAVSVKICPSIVAERECLFGEKCKYCHDVEAYLRSKLADIDGECPSFRTFGKCSYGVSCRLAHDHITEDNQNVVHAEKWQEHSHRLSTLNTLKKDITVALRKRELRFTKADAYLKSIKVVPGYKMKDLVPCERLMNVNRTPYCLTVTKEADRDGIPELHDEPNDSSARFEGDTSSSTSEIADAAPRAVYSMDECVIKLRLQEKKRIDFSSKLYLAPLTTVGNLPFRRICKTYGAEITCGEMAMATSILQGKHSEWALLKRHHTEDLFGIQLCGGHADTMTRCSELINHVLDIDFIDINVGCPIDLVFKKGEGSALMNRWNRFEQIVRGMKSVLDVPVTVKMRTGVYEDKNIAHLLVPKVIDWGASMLTLHGRSREQRYTKLADWDYIGQCAELAAPMTFFGNGDVLSYEDANRRRSVTGVSGVMVARGALIKPWLFTEIHEQRHWDISSSERFDMLKNFVSYGLTHWGSDSQGVESTRRFLLEWLSFLYRYIPVGLLERVPQKINERPPAFYGRDDMETLMASANCEDWVKISEMLLGPVPDGFIFLPKHKANAYK